MIYCGIDEVGRGPLAGPVVTAAVSFAEDFVHDEITDSKKLSAKKRDRLFEEIKEIALDWCIVAVSPRLIDSLNIRNATKKAMTLAAQELKADLFLIDGNMPIDIQEPQRCIIKGDALSPHIGAASILAKVWRDRHMSELAETFPGYGFEKHAGYPTKAHKEAIQKIGPSSFHRFSFRGVKEFEIASTTLPAFLPYATKGFSLEKKSVSTRTRTGGGRALQQLSSEKGISAA